MATLAILKSMHTLDNREFVKGLSESQRHSRTAGQRMRRTFQATTRVMRTTAVAVTALAGSMAVATQRAAAFGNSIDKSAKVAGVSTDTIQELRFAFGQLAEITDDQVDQALQKFRRRLDLARDGSGAAVKTLEKLNISLAQDTESALNQTINTLQDLAQQQDITGESSRIFGEEIGPKLAVAIETGNLDKLREELHAIDGVLSGRAINNAAAFTDEMDRIKRTVTVQMSETVLQNREAFIGLAAGLGQAAAGAAEFIAKMTTGLQVLAGAKQAFAMEDEIAAVEQKIQDMQALVSGDTGMFGEALSPKAVEAQKSRIAELREELDRLRKKQLEVLTSPGGDGAGEGGGGGGGAPAPGAPGGGGGGGGPDGEGGGIDRLGEFASLPTVLDTTRTLEKNLEAISEAQEREREMEQAHQQRLIEIRNRAQGRLLQQQLNFLDQMEAADKASGAAQVGIMTNAFATITAAGAQHSRKLFEINKAAGIANAVVATYQGAAQALRDVPYPWNLAAAATVVAAGMAKVQAIRSQSFQGGGGAAPSTSAGGGVPAVQDVSQQGQEQAGTRQNVTVQFVGSRTSARDARALLEELRDAAGDDATLGDITFQGA